MDAPINRQAQGLLSLLDIKSMGVTPRTLGPQVQPVLPMTELYLQDLEQMYYLRVQIPNAGVADQIATLATAPTGTFFGFTSSFPALPLNAAGVVEVPQGELWYVTQWNTRVFYNLAAGNRIITHLGMQLRGGAGAGSGLMYFDDQGGGSQINGSAAAEQRLEVNALKRPVWLPAGAVPGMELLMNSTAAGTGALCSASISRLRI